MGRTHDVVISGFDLDALERERDKARNAMAHAQGELDLKTLDFERMREQRDQLLKQLAAERALADRLAGVFEHFAKIVGPPDSDHDSRWVTDDELDDLWQRTQSALAAWKEARSE